MILKTVNLKKKISHVMLRYKIPCFYQAYKSEKLVRSSRSKNTGPITRDHDKFSQMRNETPLQP